MRIARTTTGIESAGEKDNMERLLKSKVHYNAVKNNMPYPAICQALILAERRMGETRDN